MRRKGSKPPPSWHEQQVTYDISKNLVSVLRDNAGISTEAAMRKVTMELLANNPFVPPTTGCPVNDLPNELLAYIFLLGTIIEEEDECSEADEEEESEYAGALESGDDWEDISDNEDEDMEVHNKMAVKKTGKGEEGWLKDSYEHDDDDEDDEEEDEEDEEREIPFQVLVSHVCRHWREIALESPVLWNKLDFTEGPPFAKSKVWIQRSKSSPLDIHIDCTEPDDHDYSGDDDSDSDSGSVRARTPGSHGGKYDEVHGECPHDPSFYSLDDLNSILDIIIPHVAQWRILDVSVSYYEYMLTLLPRLASCPSAPLLKTLSLHHYEDAGEDNDEDRVFAPPEPSLLFNGIAPNLMDVTLWGVHLDWDRCLSFLTGLQDLELAYQAKNLRPSFSTFSKILSASPELRILTLCLSGPAEYNDIDNDWGTDPIEIPSLKDLVLCYHEPKYIIALMQLLCTPNVTSLVLDYDGADYSEFVQVLVNPMPRKSKSLLAGLEHLKVAGLPCNSKSAEMFLDQLAGLHSLNLNCTGEEEEMFFDLLWQSPVQSATPPKIYCPNLHTIWTTGVYGQQMKRFIEARKAAGVPIKKVFMSEDDEVDDDQAQWIKDHVEALEFFEPSDGSEEEYIDVDEEDM